MGKFKKSDILAILILGEIVAWFLFITFRNLGVDVVFERAMTPVPAIVSSPLFFATVTPLAALFGLAVLFFLSKYIPVLWQIGKFVAVGFANTVVDFGVLNLLIFITGIPAGPAFSIFKGVSFVVAVAHSYIWNKFWTFRKKEIKSARKELIQFLAVSVVGFVLNVGVASFLVNVVGPQFVLSEKLWANVGAAVGSIVAMTWNFVGYKFFVFKR